MIWVSEQPGGNRASMAFRSFEDPGIHLPHKVHKHVLNSYYVDAFYLLKQEVEDEHRPQTDNKGNSKGTEEHTFTNLKSSYGFFGGVVFSAYSKYG